MSNEDANVQVIQPAQNMDDTQQVSPETTQVEQVNVQDEQNTQVNIESQTDSTQQQSDGIDFGSFYDQNFSHQNQIHQQYAQPVYNPYQQMAQPMQQMPMQNQAQPIQEVVQPQSDDIDWNVELNIDNNKWVEKFENDNVADVFREFAQEMSSQMGNKFKTLLDSKIINEDKINEIALNKATELQHQAVIQQARTTVQNSIWDGLRKDGLNLNPYQMDTVRSFVGNTADNAYLQYSQAYDMGQNVPRSEQGGKLDITQFIVLYGQKAGKDFFGSKPQQSINNNFVQQTTNAIANQVNQPAGQEVKADPTLSGWSPNEEDSKTLAKKYGISL